MAANRQQKTEEQARDFESAITDIQLLGSSEKIAETVKFLEAHAAGRSVTIDAVLSLLRQDLRKELGLSEVDSTVKIFRFIRNQT
jgi:DNA-binding transcriptional regulator YdaS (Cro superfamily)